MNYLCKKSDNPLMEGYYGEGLLFWRNFRRFKQDVVADHLGMSRQNYSEMERNTRKMSDQVLLSAAELFQTTPQEIQEFSPEKIVFNNQNQQGEQYNNCNIEVPKSLLETINTTLLATQEVLQTCTAMIEKLKSDQGKSG